MKAKSIKGRSAEEVRLALETAMTDGFNPTVAIAFISIKQDRKAICELLRGKGIDIVGATSAGEFIDGYQDEGSAVLLLLDLQRSFYWIVFEEIGSRTLIEAASHFAETALEKFKKPAFILCTTSLTKQHEVLDGELLIRTIENIIGPQVNIYGGMAGDDLTMTGTYVFTDGRETDNGIIGLVLNEERITLHGMAISGWKPIGVYRTVTKSTGNLIYTIDGQPAIEMYLKYLGKEMKPGEDKYQIFSEVGLHYPFQVEREVGEPVMRTPMAVDRDQNALICDFDVPQGSRLRFSMPPDFDIVDKVLQDAKELKNSRETDADALLVFSCAGRLSSLGPLINSENEGLSDVWKAPMAGFFTYGEFGRAINGKQEFHSTTCCWVALKENKS